jgi:hypothetical protein
MKKNKPGRSVGCEYLAAKTISCFGKNDVEQGGDGFVICMIAVSNYF